MAAPLAWAVEEAGVIAVMRFRLLAATMGCGVTGLLAALPAAATVTVDLPASRPTGPAPVAVRPVEDRAAPPRSAVAAPAVRCPPASYGAVARAPGRRKTVALTFDDGPGASTSAIVAVLRAHGVRATFFNIGVNEAAHPQQVRDEVRAGQTLGNHTWNHQQLTWLSAGQQAAEMERASAEQKAVVGSAPCLFRPPYGAYNATTLALARRHGMRVWLWSVDTEDWKAHGSSSSYWVQRIIARAEQGARLPHPVVLLHNQTIGNPATVRALPTIIKFFRDRGYTFVDLLGRSGTAPLDAAATTPVPQDDRGWTPAAALSTGPRWRGADGGFGGILGERAAQGSAGAWDHERVRSRGLAARASHE